MKEVIEKHLGAHTDIEQGEQYMYHCPVCHHKNDRLSVNYNKNVFHCWTCGFSGRSVTGILYYLKAPQVDIDRVKEYLGVKDTYEGGTKLSKLQYEIFRTIDKDEDNSSRQIIEQPEFWKPLSKPQDVFEKRAYKYLLKRGLSPYEIKLYNIQYDEEQDTIDIPSYDKNLQLNYYVKHYFLEGYYKNPPESSKMKIIFNEHTLDFTQPIIVTEGFYDAVSIGFNAVPILGKFMPKALIQQIVYHNTPVVYLFMDGDAKKEVVDLSNYLSYIGINTKIVDVPDGEDPNSLGRNNIDNLLSNSKSIDFQTKIQMMMNNK